MKNTPQTNTARDTAISCMASQVEALTKEAQELVNEANDLIPALNALQPDSWQRVEITPKRDR